MANYFKFDPKVEKGVKKKCLVIMKSTAQNKITLFSSDRISQLTQNQVFAE